MKISKDVADIYLGAKEPTSISRVNGKESVTVQLVRDAQINLIELSHNTRDVIDKLNKKLASKDIEIVIQSDTAELMEKNIDKIIELALVGGLLAIIILYFFLRNLRLVIVISLAIPISIFTAFNFFYAFDITINSLTLIGMALAVGMLLDNSIVVLENIYRLVVARKDIDNAVIQGTREVWRSIFAATLTTTTSRGTRPLKSLWLMIPMTRLPGSSEIIWELQTPNAKLQMKTANPGKLCLIPE